MTIAGEVVLGDKFKVEAVAERWRMASSHPLPFRKMSEWQRNIMKGGSEREQYATSMSNTFRSCSNQVKQKMRSGSSMMMD